jgi:hypothetical protein
MDAESIARRLTPAQKRMVVPYRRAHSIAGDELDALFAMGVLSGDFTGPVVTRLGQQVRAILTAQEQSK